MTTIRTTARRGWIPDLPDHRDQYMTVAAPVALPPGTDLRTTGFLSDVYDQLQLSSCTANAIAAAVDFERKRQGEPFITPSRLFVYYAERQIEGTVPQDCGAQIRDGIKSVVSLGVCPESEWPYSDQGNQFAVQPSPQCYADALKFKTVQYSRVTQSDYHLKHCLAILGRPVVFGITCFSGLDDPDVGKTGDVPMPGPNEAPQGGHAILLVGYDDSKKKYTFRNSWGTSFGQAGYGTLDYNYVEDANLASDFWTILGDL
jgi:C1A family cysteine protease